MNDQDALQFLTDGIEEYTTLRTDPAYTNPTTTAKQWLHDHDRRIRAQAFQEGKTMALAAYGKFSKMADAEKANPYEDIEAGGNTIVHFPPVLTFGRLDAYHAAIRAGATPEQLTTAARAYKASCRNENKPMRFIPQPANWLTNGQWRDHLPAPAKPELPSEAWIGRNLFERLPPGADMLAARRQLVTLIRDGTPQDQAAATIIRESSEP